MDISANTWNDRERSIYDAGVAAGHSDKENDTVLFADKIKNLLERWEPREVGSAKGVLDNIQRLVDGELGL